MSELMTEIPEGATIVLPPHGFVDLQRSLASDLDVVNAARVSVRRTSEWNYATPDGEVFDDWDAADDHLFSLLNSGWFEKPENKNLEQEEREVLKLDDEQLVRWLLSKKHGTPFEHNYFKFHIRAPIFVFREWHRHRIGVSINEESARYTPLMGDFYIPEGDAWRRQVGKPGAYKFEVVDDLEAIAHAADQMQGVYDHAYEVYTQLMADGWAKELARAVLPVGIYSQMIWSCNARSLMAFLSLRTDLQAQYEIRQYANQMEKILQESMPVTHAAFVENGRVAP